MNMDSRSLFDGLKIMEHKDIVETYMNKYPVISLTLKDEQNTLDETNRETFLSFTCLFSAYYYPYQAITPFFKPRIRQRTIGLPDQTQQQRKIRHCFPQEKLRGSDSNCIDMLICFFYTILKSL